MNVEAPNPAFSGKCSWQGRLLGVQPRIRLSRAFDQQHHSYLGYSLFLRGTVDGVEREFSVGIGKAAQDKHAFRAGEEVSGQSYPVPPTASEPVEFYRTSQLKKHQAQTLPEPAPGPPWLGLCPALEIYRERGHRRLDSRTYEKECRGCLWGCRMPVEIIVDQWKPHIKRHRHETFCYGPKSCPLHRPGPKRNVPGRKGMTWVEEDWVDEEHISHRGPDE